MSSSSKSVRLGRGAYGSVTLSEDSETAVKTFRYLSHLVQEAIAITYLGDCPHVVHARGLDLERKELHMEVFRLNLREWLQDLYDRNLAVPGHQRRIIERDILLGLRELHGRGLTHGDIKPSNILVRPSPLSLVLGDLGFVSVSRYSKVDRTAPAYRDPNPSRSPSHDMYSFGIILLELEGGVRPMDQLSYRELQRLAEKNIPSGSMRDLVLSLFSPHHEKRPTAAQALNLLDVSLDTSPVPPSIPNILYLDKKKDKRLERWMRTATNSNHLRRGKRGYFALSTFFATHPKIPEKHHLLYCLAMLLILSSLFGPSGYDEQKVLRACPQASPQSLNRALTNLITNKTVVTILLLPTK